MKTYMIIGVGRFGSAVAETLFNMGHEVIILDCNEAALNHAAENATHAAIGDAREPEVLRAAGAAECDTAIVAMGGDLAANVLITMNLKDIGVPNVVCKARNEQYRRVLERVGADRVVIPEREMGIRMAQNLVSNSFLDYIELSDRCGIVEIKAPKAWEGKTLGELNVRKEYRINVLALRSEKNDSMIMAPGAGDIVARGGSVMIMGDIEELARLQKL